MMARRFSKAWAIGRYRSMFNLSKFDEIELHYGKRGPAQDRSECVTDVVETGQHDALQRGGPM